MEKEKYSILVVDDDPKIVELLRVNLVANDYDVDVAYDGEEAIAKVINQGGSRPDLIILDLMLPKKDGFEVARTIKEKKSLADIPIIILSAKDKPLDKIEGLLINDVDYYLTKPIEMEDLMIHIFKALDKKSKQKM